MVISVSRRCDIPRFKFNWFLEKLDIGHVEVKNPFNANQIRRVSLLPPEARLLPVTASGPEEQAEVFAFWTRDPKAILDNSDELEKRGYGFFVMTTLTSYPAILEPNAPPLDRVIQTMRSLADKITADRVIWRYDPVFLSNITDFGFHRRNFAAIAARLNGKVNKVIISLYDEYSRAEKRLAALEREGVLGRITDRGPEFKDLICELARIAQREGMEIQSCAEELSDLGIKSGACIDGEYLHRIFGFRNSGLKVHTKDPGQRSRCLCVQSVDIGSYGDCPAGCVYCYAS